MSPSMQIALSAWVGVATVGLAILGRLLHERKEPGWQDVVFGVPAAAFIGASVFNQVHEGGMPRAGRLILTGIILGFGLVGLVGTVRELRTFWHDEDELAELYGSNEGYIPRRSLITLRYKALLHVLLAVGVVAAIAVYFFLTLYAPEHS